MVTNQQLYVALSVPVLFNAAAIGLLISKMNARFRSVDVQFKALNDRIAAEIRRVEEKLDARLKHLEER